jgi:predicted O-methyltransferase YrrM
MRHAKSLINQARSISTTRAIRRAIIKPPTCRFVFKLFFQKDRAEKMIISRKTKEMILSLPGAWLFLIPLRLFNVCNTVLRSQVVLLTGWCFSSREFTNCSYHSTMASMKRLAVTLSKIEGVSCQAVMGYCTELNRDVLLQNMYLQARNKEKMLRNLTDAELRPGRQILYYCLTRALKPKVVFEAGTAHGMGSLLIVHALKLNEAEGFSGKLITVDLNPNAGKLLKHLPSDYRASMNFIISDTESALRLYASEIDLFFHDTVNIASHEKNHYDLLDERISRDGVICTSWGMSGMLAEYSEKSDRRYLEFTSQPERHWSCDTMGISLPSTLKAPSLRKPARQLSSHGILWSTPEDLHVAAIAKVRT